MRLIFICLLLVTCGKSATRAPDTTSTTQGTNSTGSLVLTSSLKYYNFFPFNNVYTLDVTVGGQQIETVLDTGSSNLLVLGNAQLCPGCQNEYGYTSTFVPTSTTQALSANWSMNFAPIGSATVKGYADTVSFGNITIKAFPFGLVTAEQGIPNIWGIAYGSLANPSSAPQTPLFDAMVSAAAMKNQFSLRLCALKKGSVVFLGGFDTAVANQSTVQWTPIVQKVWYTVPVTRMYIAGSSISSPAWQWELSSSDSLIVDSGTNPLVLPASAVSSLVTLLQNTAASNGISIPSNFWPTASGHGGFVSLTDAQIAKFPTIFLDLVSYTNSSQTFTLSIAPTTYFQTRQDGQRFLGIQPGPASQYILGTVFMENYVVFHDRGTLSSSSATDATARLGFYPSTGLCQ